MQPRGFEAAEDRAPGDDRPAAVGQAAWLWSLGGNAGLGRARGVALRDAGASVDNTTQAVVPAHPREGTGKDGKRWEVLRHSVMPRVMHNFSQPLRTTALSHAGIRQSKAADQTSEKQGLIGDLVAQPLEVSPQLLDELVRQDVHDPPFSSAQ